MDKLTSTYLSIDLAKLDDDGERLVIGIASTPEPDQQGGVWEGQPYEGDVVDPQAMREALDDYLTFANVREMHANRAAGVVERAEMLDNGATRIAVRVVDDDAWKKVRSGVYKGFSIGGRVLKAVLEQLPDGRIVRRILKLLLTEISLVDRPANPAARILVFKRDDGGPMPPETDETTTDQAADPVDALRTLVQKATSDPQKIVAQIQAARNECEMGGDTEGAELYTQAIKLILQAAGDAEEPEPEPAMPDEAPAEEAALAASAQATTVRKAAQATTVRKAGRALSGARMAAMQQVAKTLLQLLAEAGDGWAQKVLGAGTADAGADVAMSTKLADAMADAIKPQFELLAKGLLALNERLQVVEQQPAPGGPVLRRVEKVLGGQQPTLPARPEPSALIKQQLDELRQLANTHPNPALRSQYRQQYEALQQQYQ